ncbi:MAG: c-type cytochrome [Steroidobacteraceae bacterium]
MKLSARLAIVAAAWLLVVTFSALAADVDPGLCTLCHGTEARGNAAVRAPRLAGLAPWYLQGQIRAYQANLRGIHPTDLPGNEMRFIAATLTDEAAVDEVLVRFSKGTPTASTSTVSGDAVRGEQLYASCAACHGGRGEGNESLKAPALAGGSDWYQLAQLRNFTQGLRGTEAADPTGQQMRAAASALPDSQAAADVVAYISTLRGL